jgi:hypothetical protein
MIRITENHKRGIKWPLYLLDKTLCDFEQYAQGRQKRSVLYHQLNTLSDKQRKQLLSEIEVVKKLLSEIKDKLGLEIEEENIARDITGRCASLWVILTETTSKYLKQYGDVPPELSDFLDPIIEQIISHLQHVNEISKVSSDHNNGQKTQRTTTNAGEKE